MGVVSSCISMCELVLGVEGGWGGGGAGHDRPVWWNG